MKKFYFQYKSSSSIKLIKWRRQRNIVSGTEAMSDISRSDIVHMLKYFQNGFNDILKNRADISPKLEIKFNIFENLSFNRAITYLLLNIEMLKTPIILNKEKM